MKKKGLLLGLNAVMLTMCLASCGEIGFDFNNGIIIVSSATSTSFSATSTSFSATSTSFSATSTSFSATSTTVSTSEMQIINGYQRIDQENVLFGTYPQSKVTDTTTLTSLKTKVSKTKPTSSNAQGFTSYKYYIGDGYIDADGEIFYESEPNTTDYMWYKDIDLDNDGNNDYRCVYFDQYRPYDTQISSSTDYSFQYYNGYNTGNYYFFKYEPIKWKILKEENGKATILADLILDSQDYNYTTSSQIVNGETIYANNYEYS